MDISLACWVEARALKFMWKFQARERGGGGGVSEVIKFKYIFSHSHAYSWANQSFFVCAAVVLQQISSLASVFNYFVSSGFVNFCGSQASHYCRQAKSFSIIKLNRDEEKKYRENNGNEKFYMEFDDDDDRHQLISIECSSSNTKDDRPPNLTATLCVRTLWWWAEGFKCHQNEWI